MRNSSAPTAQRLGRWAVFAVSLAVSALPVCVDAAEHVLDARLRAVQWTAEDGKQVSIAQWQGKPIVMTMAYAGCRKTCSTTLLVLKEIQKIFERQGRSAEFVVVTYAPDAEAPRAWSEYRKSRGLERRNWHFLSGTTQDTQRLARMLDLSYWSYDEHVMHDFRVVLFDADGMLTREINWRDISNLTQVLAGL
jgi:cytochrome oxidase Cu insertion factor (SCO1/SenC/PrrC family)